MNRSPLRAFLLLPFVLACFALSPQARAVCQEGCLTNQNTVPGDDALLNNTGIQNTAIGFQALFSNTGGYNNPESVPQFGLVAEEVEKVNPDLVARDEQDKPYTVRYEAVNAMLLNEFLKEHRKVEE